MSPQTAQPSVLQKRAFLIRLGGMLHRYGTPAYRLEAHLNNVAEHLQMGGHFLVNPTSLTFCLWPVGTPEQPVYNYSMRVAPGELDLGSLARADALVEDFVLGGMSLEQAMQGLGEIESAGPVYSTGVTLLAFSLIPAAFALLMRATWPDVLFSLGLGVVVYGLVWLAERRPRIAQMLEPLAATTVAFLAVAAATVEPRINQPLLVLSSIVVFVPGLSLALGLRDLAARELISGTARIMDALMVLFKLYFGTVLGAALGVQLWGVVSPLDAPAVPDVLVWPAVLLLSCCLAVVFKTQWRDAPWGVASGLLAFAVSDYLRPELGLALAAFAGAFAVGIYANLFARWRNAPAVLVTLQGIVILVPGSKVYVGLNAAVSGQQILPADQIGVQSFMLFMSLIAGLVFSSAVVEPRKSL